MSAGRWPSLSAALLLLAGAGAACRGGPSPRAAREAACAAGEGAACARLAAELEALCSSSEAGACRDLAGHHLAGRTGRVDRLRAVRLYEKACETGEGSACREAAAFDPETPRAERLLQAGCDLDDAPSCSDLLAELRTAGREPERAEALFRTAETLHGEACASGRAEGCMGLGRLYALVAPADEAKAAPFLLEAARMLSERCEGGEAAACLQLAAAHQDGAGVQFDLDRQRSLVERACALGDPRGCAEAAASYTASETPDDDPKAPALYERACLAGVIQRQPCREAGFLYVDGAVVPADKARAARLLERGCALGDAPSCWMAAGMLREGDGVARDPARAAELVDGPGPDITVVSVERTKQAPDPVAIQLGIDPLEYPPVTAESGQDLILVTFDVRRGPLARALPVRTVWVLDAEGRRHPSVLKGELPFGETDHERREVLFVVPEGARPVRVRFELGALTLDLPSPGKA